ncbi:hypothetical protein SCHPADRAFT_927253 [Schizopora paradoxa]|uniref:Uncharacterized protein n=1 Tax=Schizopora paradoxa TaxID=27342 RepID=A0A0H2RUR2_9AGAM|nr:hypothetical protein SCHPADRAFT_927253 [Schizopora paradoxa]
MAYIRTTADEKISIATILDGESLETAMHKVISSWLARNDPIPEAWKQVISPIDAMPCNDLLALGPTTCRQLASQSQSSLRRLRCLSEIFNGLSFVFAEKFRVASENSYVVRNMCGLGTLPNELLVRIFEFVVFGDRTLPNRWRAAVPLSHVCQYFRNTILACPLLWSDISGNGGIAALSLSRSKEVPLNVSFKIDTSGSSLDFNIKVSDASMYSKRWSTLVLQLIRKDSRQFSNRHMAGTLDMTEVCRGFGELDAPLLETLYILNSSGLALSEENGGFSQWNTPNLRYLNTMHIPLTIRGLSNVTHLTLMLSMDQFGFHNFFKSLTQMRSLKVLVLKLKSVLIGRAAGEIQEFNQTELHVLRLRVEVYAGSITTRSFIQTLFSLLSFPRAISLEIRIIGDVESRNLDEDYDEEPMLSASREVNSIVQHGGQFPLVERFSLDTLGVVDEARKPNSLTDLKRGVILVDVPIDKLPRLKHLLLGSNGTIRLSVPIQGWSNTTTCRTFKTTSCLPALQTISVMILSPGRARGFANFVNALINEQKGRGGWGAFQKLIVTADDRSVNKGGRRETVTYVGDDALAWCERRNNREDGGLKTYLD